MFEERIVRDLVVAVVLLSSLRTVSNTLLLADTILESFWLNLRGPGVHMPGGPPEHKKQPRDPRRSTSSEKVEFLSKH